MYTIKPLPEFDAWFNSLKDPVTRARLIRRLEKAARGLLGDVEPIGEGVSEMRELFGPGWRMYYIERPEKRRGRPTMTKKTIKVSELPTFDPARYLRDDEDIAAYLTQVIEEGDTGELAQALGVAARARGMAQIAEAAGIGRESLYKALRADASPRFDTIAKVCKALGVRLVVQVEHSA